MNIVQYPSRTHRCAVETPFDTHESVVLERVKEESRVLSFFLRVRCVFCGETWSDMRVHG